MQGEKGTNLGVMMVTNQEELVVPYWRRSQGFRWGGCHSQREGQWEKGAAVWEGVIAHHGQGDTQEADTFFRLEHRQDVWVGETDLGVAGAERVPEATGGEQAQGEGSVHAVRAGLACFLAGGTSRVGGGCRADRGKPGSPGREWSSRREG